MSWFSFLFCQYFIGSLSHIHVYRKNYVLHLSVLGCYISIYDYQYVSTNEADLKLYFTDK